MDKREAGHRTAAAFSAFQAHVSAAATVGIMLDFR
jgi:hypothetical protein